ncbi:MAG TPA: hypothetical protein VE396_09590 [Xanthobacteraceae bacterium]|nr:hypothetical protein [Xanthobacteraceae bacterium]
MVKKRKVRIKRKAKRNSVVQIWTGHRPPIKRADFHVGCEFLTASGRWRCTDVGKRTIAAIRLNHDDDPSWYNGPPYAVTETVFDEYDFEGCEPAPERRTYDATASEIAPVRRRKRRHAKSPAKRRPNKRTVKRAAKPARKSRPKRNSRGEKA